MSGEDEELPDDALDDEDLGPPVDLGALAGAGTPPAFLDHLRGRIERRQLSADVASLFWALPGTVLRGLLWGLSPPQPPETKDESDGGSRG